MNSPSQTDLQERLLLCGTVPQILPKSREQFLRGKDFPGIGELSERSLHQMLKVCYQPDPSFREIPIGDFVADVRDERGIFEIQTGSFGRLRPKLPVFLSLCEVTVVYPITQIKYLTWVNPESGELSKPRKSGKRGHPLSALHELYAIREFLLHPRLTVELLFFEMDEYRLLCGYSADKKRGSVRTERIPRMLRERIILKSPADYLTLLPEEFRRGEAFTAPMLQKTLRLRNRAAYSAVHVLQELSLLESLPPIGRAAAYRAVSPFAECPQNENFLP